MFVVCKVQNCGYNSHNGFCLNRLLVVNEQGVCNRLTKPGWDQEVEDRFKNNYMQEVKSRAPVHEEIKTDPLEDYIEEIEDIWGQSTF